MKQEILKNPLTINTINAQLIYLTNIIKHNTELQLNLSEITNIDSSGIALLIELKQVAVQSHCVLLFQNTTEAVQRLLTLYKIII